jgi:hypothetical protein
MRQAWIKASYLIAIGSAKIQTLTIMSPKSSAQQVKTRNPASSNWSTKLLDKHIYLEIAELLNQQGYRREDQRGAAATMPASPPILAPMIWSPQITSRVLVPMADHYSRPC